MQKTLEGLLHRILYQLLSQAEDLAEFVVDLYRNHAEVQGQWLLTYLERAFINIAGQRKVRINICLFIDALDEHSEDYGETHWRLIEILQRFMDKADGKHVRVMLCLSSRPENVFNDVFKRSPTFQVHLKTNFDIQVYVHGRNNKYLATRDDLCSDPEAIKSLTATCEEVVRRAQGVFLWVKLATTFLIEGLVDGENAHDIKMTLSSIRGDGDLSQLYHRILLRIQPPYLLEAFIMLQIAAAALTPWPTIEFFQAVSYIPSDKQTFDAINELPSELEIERKLRSRCRTLLELQDSADVPTQQLFDIPKGGEIVQVLHRTVKEYLTESNEFDSICDRLHLFKRGDGHEFITAFRVKQHLRWYERQPSLVTSVKESRRNDIFLHAILTEKFHGYANIEPLDLLADFVHAHDLASEYLSYPGSLALKPRSFLALAVRAGLFLYTDHVLSRPRTYPQKYDEPLLH